MGNKGIIIIVAIIIGLTAVYFLGDSSSNTSTNKNQKLLNLTENITKLKITKNKISVTIYQDNNVWLVKEKNNYPADVEKVAEIINELREVKSDTFYTKNPAQHSKFELEDPDKSEDSKGATKIELMNSSDKVIDGIIIGKTKSSKKQSDTPWSSGSSIFARNINSDDVFLCNASIKADNAPSNWLKKQFLDIKKNKFREITITKQGTPSIIVSRTSPKSHFRINKLDKSLKQTDHAVDNLARAAESLQMESVMTIEEAKDQKFIHKYTMKTFDGMVYTFELTDAIKEKSGQHNFKITADFDKEYILDKSKAESDKKLKIKRLTLEAATEKTKLFNDTHSKWRYLMASWVSKKYLKVLSDITEKVKKEEPKKEKTEDKKTPMPFLPKEDSKDKKKSDKKKAKEKKSKKKKSRKKKAKERKAKEKKAREEKANEKKSKKKDDDK